MAKGVSNTHKEYDEMLPLWTRCQDVAEGTHSLWAKTTEYLPKLSGETDSEYLARLKRTVLYNATWRTIVGFLGLLFRKPAVITVPSGIESWMDDVTLTGVSLRLFMAEISEEVLLKGRAGIWVNYPFVEPGSTRADALAAGARPSMTIYGAESIINWQTTRVGNATRLSRVVLKEEFEYPDGEFDVTCVDRYRVLDLDNGVYRIRVFEVKRTLEGEFEDVLVDGPFYPIMNSVSMTFLPFYFISPDDTEPEVDIPPFIDLVDTNIAHYQVTADYEHGCHWSGNPTLVVTGHAPEKGEEFHVGAGTAVCFPEPTSKAYMLEAGTGGFTALEKNLDRKEAQMVVLGARLLEVQKPGIEAAETALIHRSGEQSILASMAQTISTGGSAALQTYALFAGETGVASVELNRDFFHTPMSADLINALVKSWQSKAISFETMFSNLQKGEVYPPDAKPEKERARIVSAGDPGTAIPLTPP